MFFISNYIIYSKAFFCERHCSQARREKNAINPLLKSSIIINQISIRVAGKEDAELIADLSRTTFIETFAPQNTKENMDKFMKEQFTHERLAKEVGALGNIFLLAELNGEPVGYARLRDLNNPPEFRNLPSLEIARIYSIQSQIGKGIGAALMKECIEVARQRNKKVIWLGVWKENHRAIKFYERWDFEIFGEHDFHLGDDLQKDWLMKREV
jgi:ribosomal protein S18 acetylase RimI-like enzyme